MLVLFGDNKVVGGEVAFRSLIGEASGCLEMVVSLVSRKRLRVKSLLEVPRMSEVSDLFLCVYVAPTLGLGSGSLGGKGGRGDTLFALVGGIGGDPGGEPENTDSAVSRNRWRANWSSVACDPFSAWMLCLAFSWLLFSNPSNCIRISWIWNSRLCVAWIF